MKSKERMLKNKLTVGTQSVPLGKVILDSDLDSMRMKSKKTGKISVVPYISKAGIKRIIDYFGLKVCFLWLDDTGKLREDVIPSIQALGKTFYVWCKVYKPQVKQEPAIEVGEINSGNIKGIASGYPLAMLWKRARGRAVLEYVGLYDLFSQEELEGGGVVSSESSESPDEEVDEMLEG